MAIKQFSTTGSHLDVRLALLRQDFDLEKHGDTVSFWADDEPLFQSKDGKLDQYSQVSLSLYGFDEPSDGMAVSITGPDGQSSILYGEDTDALEEDLAKLLAEQFLPDTRYAEAIAKVVVTSWGFACDYDEVQEEALDQLEKFTYVSDAGSDVLQLDSNPAAGSVLIDIVLSSDVPATIAPDGAMTFPEDLEWDDLRGDRFICLITPEFNYQPMETSWADQALREAEEEAKREGELRSKGEIYFQKVFDDVFRNK